MDTTQIPTEDSKTITLLLSDYLDDLWIFQRGTYYSATKYALVPKFKGEMIRKVDPTESIVHVEFTSDGRNAEVFPIGEWLTTEMYNRAKKKASEDERAKKYKTIDDMGKLADELGKNELFGVMMSREQLMALAKKIILNGDVATAKKFGVEL